MSILKNKLLHSKVFFKFFYFKSILLVVSDITKKKDEEKKVDTPKETNSNKVKMSLNFSLNRDNVIKDKLSANEVKF